MLHHQAASERVETSRRSTPERNIKNLIFLYVTDSWEFEFNLRRNEGVDLRATTTAFARSHQLDRNRHRRSKYLRNKLIALQTHVPEAAREKKS
jgi:hypothetical protein